MMHHSMNPLPATIVAFAVLCLGCVDARAGETPVPAPATLPASPGQDRRMEWFRQARYGLFIHWGLYAIPAGEWKGKPVRPC